VLARSAVASALPEYSAAEARKHIGENATVVGTIDCIGHGRRHVDLQIGGCDLSKAQLWIVLPNDATGLEVDPEALRGVTVAVTGKIESSSDTPQLTVKSTTQIQPRSALQTNYIGHAYDKEQKGDIDGAIADLNEAIEHQPARRDEACQHLASVKAGHGDWAGALAAYDRLVSFDPNNSGSYYTRAMAEKQHGDFEAAMSDFNRAAELRSSASDFIQIGNFRKEKGDITGAAAEYDKAIALCDRQIAGTAKSDPRSPLGSDPYFSRGCARELKGDLDGALADYTQAIANNPARAAMAYSARGNILRARGDLNGAIADYQHKYQITHYPDDKQKLEQARAEAKAGAMKVVVTQPSTQAAQDEQSFNKSEVTPESIAEAFVQAYSGADVNALAGLYADRVDYSNSGVISNASVGAQAREYFARWPVRQWSLVGPVKTISLGATKQKIIFSASYDASDPQTNRHASGIAKETLIFATDPSGAMKIVSQKEQTSKRGSSQPGEKTSGDLRLSVAKAEYEHSSHDEAARIRYVTKLADIYKAELGSALAAVDVEHELRKHPMPRNVDSRKLTQLVIGNWDSPRHTYVFRADGTYGVSDEQRDKWRIDGNEYIDDVSRGPIILLDRNYFIYAEGQGAAVYIRANDSEAERK
jgi:tetratricopeptide (TPR) repeat protein